MSTEREQKKVEEKDIETQARRVTWKRREALIGKGDEWIPRSFIAEGPFGAKAKNTRFVNRFIPLEQQASG